MKRDMELIRKILLAVEEAEDVKRGERPRIDGYDDEVVQAHIGLMRQRGLVNAIDASSFDGEAYVITGLTWEGHDFIEVARNEAVWRKAIKVVMEKGGGVTLEIMIQLLKNLLRQQVLGDSRGEVI